jgi:hypothetical protein
MDVETDKYIVKLEGYLDMGRTNDNTSFKLHAGKIVGQRDEAFFEVNFIPHSVTWELMPGWGHRIGKGTVVGSKYNVSGQQNIIFLNQELGSNWSMRVEHNQSTAVNEIGVRYKMQDFLSLEYVFTNNDNWLRLVANL